MTRAMPLVNARPWSFHARLALLVFGLFLYGLAVRFMLDSGVGLSPWDAFHQGLARQTGITIGLATILTGLVVLSLSWLVLRVRPGLGSVLNMLLIGVFVDLLAPVRFNPTTPLLQWSEFACGVLLAGVATGTYIASHMGAGPRDGLIMGFSSRTGCSVGRIRTGIELLVLIAGFALGGHIGWGTLAFALGIGPAMTFGFTLYGLERRATPVRSGKRT